MKIKMKQMVNHVWLIVMAVEFIGVESSSVDIDLTGHLRIFENCTVHIIQAVVNNLSSAYNWKPFEFPVVYSQYIYIYTPSLFPWYYGPRCGNKVYTLGSGEGFHGNVTYIHSQKCQVWIYLTPADCRSWIGGLWTKVTLEETFMPPTDLNLMVHKSVTEEVRDKDKSRKIDITRKEDKDIYIDKVSSYPVVARGGRYFAILGTKDTLNQPKANSLFHYVDMTFERESVFLPVKLYFQVRAYTKLSAHNTIGLTTRIQKTYVVGSTNQDLLDNHIDLLDDLLNSESGFNPVSSVFDVGSLKYRFNRIDLPAFSFVEQLEVLQLLVQDSNKIWGTRCPRYCTIKLTSHHPYCLQTNQENMGNHWTFLTLLVPNITFVYPNDYSQWFPVFAIQETRYEFQFTRIETKGFHFVTCADIFETEGISFLGFVSAFDHYIWMLLIVITSILVLIAFRWFVGGGVKLDWIFFPIASLLEQGTSLTNRYRLLTASWVLMCIILSNSYKGGNITKLTAPLGRERIEYFDQLIRTNFSIVALTENNMISSSTWMSEINEIFQILGQPTNVTMLHMNTHFGRAYGKNGSNGDKPSTLSSVRKMVRKPDTIPEWINLMNASHMFNLISTCTRVAGIDEYADAYEMFLKLKHFFWEQGNTTAYRSATLSSDSLGRTTSAWMFRNVQYPTNRFIIRVHAMFESGLVQSLEDWSFRVTTWNATVDAARSEEKEEVKGLTIHGNTRVVFIVYLVGLLITATEFSIESRNVMFGVYAFYTSIKEYIMHNQTLKV